MTQTTTIVLRLVVNIHLRAKGGVGNREGSGKFFFFFRKCFEKFSVLAGRRCPPDPPVFGWGGKAPQTLPLNGRPQHLIEAAKRGRLDQMIFFSAPLTTRAPPTTVRPGT